MIFNKGFWDEVPASKIEKMGIKSSKLREREIQKLREWFQIGYSILVRLRKIQPR